MTTKVTDDKPEPLHTFYQIVVGVIIALIAYALLLIQTITKWEERGQFGDMFGAANTLFSGLAFAALTYALFLQRRELAMTRAVLMEQTAAQTQQAKTALRAAKISALGSLMQSYAQLIACDQHGLVGEGRPSSTEIREVRDELRSLLTEENV